jgi:hypothetical protein
MDDTDLPVAEIEHRLPGRIRLRLRGRQSDAAFFARAAKALAEVPGVHAVKANPRTASLLLEYRGDEEAVLGAARDKALFHAEPPRLASAFGPVREGTTLSVSPLHLAAGGLAGAGLLQLVRGRALGSATENFWNAYHLFANTRHPSAALLVAFGLLQMMRGPALGSAVSLFVYAYHVKRRATDRGAATTA